MERFLVDEFIVDPGRNVVIAPDGSETRLEPKVMEVLCVLAAHPGEVVSRDLLIERVWGVEFGADEAPTRAISILRKVFGDPGNGSRCIETIPKRGYRLIAPVRALAAASDGPELVPPRLASPPPGESHEPVRPGEAGAAHRGKPERPPEGSHNAAALTGARPNEDRPANSEAGKSVLSRISQTAIRLREEHGTGLALFSGIALIASVILGVLATGTGDRPPLHFAQPIDDKTVAVLPFTNRSTEEKDAFLADGFHETLLTQLSKISSLKVISRTSMMQYRTTDKSTPRIARELGAAVVMEGSVHRSGKRIRINVQLIDGATDTHMWAEIYDVDLTPENLFAVQSDISGAIASALETVLTDTDHEILAKVPTRNPAAWEAYLRGRIDGDMERYSAVLWQRAIQEYEKAIRLDPRFAEAYAGKARAHLQLYWVGKNPEHIEAANRALRRAEELAPDAVETLTALAWYHYWGLLDFEKADALLRSALKKAPNSADILMGLAAIARRAGRFDDAIGYLERAQQLDPLSLSILHGLATIHVIFGRFQPAQSIVAQAKLVDPENPLTIRTAAFVGQYMGKPDLAWNEFAVPVANADEDFFASRSAAARLTGSPAHLQTALANWPEALRHPEGRPEPYRVWEAYLLEMQGKSAQARELFSDIANRAEARPELVGWGRSIEPSLLSYWRRDLDAVRAAFAEFESRKPKDAWLRLFQLDQFARAFARAGDPETALDLMETYQKNTAPSAYLWISIHPDFDGLRRHPRYLALKSEYEKWARENEQD